MALLRPGAVKQLSTLRNHGKCYGNVRPDLCICFAGAQVYSAAGSEESQAGCSKYQWAPPTLFKHLSSGLH